MRWSEVEAAAARIHWGAFLASADRDGKPHVAFVSPGLADERIWVVSDRGTRKVRNIQDNPYVALHWPVDPDDTNLQLFVEGTAQVRASDSDKRHLWDRNPVPWDLADFYTGPTDPNLVFIEIAPTYASLSEAFGEAFDSWRK